ncbi:hypothetical protein AAVH_42695, partial [Aphelenchoides avenae]
RFSAATTRDLGRLAARLHDRRRLRTITLQLHDRHRRRHCDGAPDAEAARELRRLGPSLEQQRAPAQPSSSADAERRGRLRELGEAAPAAGAHHALLRHQTAGKL